MVTAADVVDAADAEAAADVGVAAEAAACRGLAAAACRSTEDLAVAIHLWAASQAMATVAATAALVAILGSELEQHLGIGLR